MKSAASKRARMAAVSKAAPTAGQAARNWAEYEGGGNPPCAPPPPPPSWRMHAHSLSAFVSTPVAMRAAAVVPGGRPAAMRAFKEANRAA